MANEQRLIDANAALKKMQNWNTKERLINCVEDAPTVDAAEVVHAYWTGLTPQDYAFAEGFPTEMSMDEKAKRLEDFMHTTHCSNCFGGFDDRAVKHWRYCPYCGAKMDGERREGNERKDHKVD